MSRQSIELQMIVKNESVNLARCLRSIRDVVDRIVIGDTGSTDNTAAIARTFAAEIISVPWNGDFAAARNAVLRHSRCAWILILDADEMLDANGAQALAKAAQQPKPAAYDVRRWNYVLETHSHSGEHGALRNPGLLPESSSYPAYVKSINTRLFRRHPQVNFERPVHETVVNRLQKLQLSIAVAPFVIHHFGHTEDAKADRARKNEIYYQIGMRHLEKNPDDARTCFELGLVELDYFKKPEAALSLFLRALQLNQQDSEPWIFAGVSLVRMQKYVEAIELLSHAAKFNPHSIVLQESLGDAWFHQGSYPQALASYRCAMQMGSASALVLAKHGVCEIYCGRREAGLRALQDALRREPDFPELLDVVVAGAALSRDNVLAAKVAHRRLSMAGTSAFHYALAGTLLSWSGESALREDVIREGLSKFPNDPALAAER
jgi:glycosyltransferase involved in cell wall biosynthesis